MALPGFRLPDGYPKTCPRCGFIANGPNVARIHTRDEHPEALTEGDEVGCGGDT